MKFTIKLQFFVKSVKYNSITILPEIINFYNYNRQSAFATHFLLFGFMLVGVYKEDLTIELKTTNFAQWFVAFL